MIYIFDIPLSKVNSMRSIALKLKEKVLADSEAILQHLDKSRNRYFNEAIDFYNKHQRRALIEKRLAEESLIVKEDSLAVLGEFEMLDDDV